MNTKHTPGPWHVGDLAAPNLAGRNALVYAPSGYAVADAKIFHCKFGVPEMEANARLIAAAPDLLEALTFALERLEACNYEDEEDECIVIVSAAIAKATGKAA